MAVFLLLVIIIIVDQATKYWACTVLKPMGAIPVIDGILDFAYVENYGAAFGMLQNAKWFFIVVKVVISAAIIYYLVTRSVRQPLLKSSLVLILAGAIGNLIDRLRLGYVVDFIYIKAVNFAVFNIADSSIVIGTILLVYFILFKTDKKYGGYHGT
ncbi:MAG TPA: signal peptidase II [Clostridiales bacterium]|nr:signal peptidase II [Clostridiales bacterium]